MRIPGALRFPSTGCLTALGFVALLLPQCSALAVNTPYGVVSNLAKSQLDPDQTTEAEQSFRTVLKQSPSDAGAHSGLAQALLKEGQQDAPQAELTNALHTIHRIWTPWRGWDSLPFRVDSLPKPRNSSSEPSNETAAIR